LEHNPAGRNQCASFEECEKVSLHKLYYRENFKKLKKQNNGSNSLQLGTFDYNEGTDESRMDLQPQWSDPATNYFKKEVIQKEAFQQNKMTKLKIGRDSELSSHFLYPL
jgi:hypothetical protein